MNDKKNRYQTELHNALECVWTNEKKNYSAKTRSGHDSRYATTSSFITCSHTIHYRRLRCKFSWKSFYFKLLVFELNRWIGISQLARKPYVFMFSQENPFLVENSVDFLIDATLKVIETGWRRRWSSEGDQVAAKAELLNTARTSRCVNWLNQQKKFLTSSAKLCKWKKNHLSC